MKKILFFIRSLNAGGAERQLIVTTKGLAERGHDIAVLTFYSGGFYADELKGTSVQLLSLDKKGRWDVFGFLLRLRKIIRQQAPDAIYSFLGTANILTVLMRPFIQVKKLVWGVRASNMDLEQYDWLSRWSYQLECYLSKFADLIIANSNAGKDYAVAHGFPEDNITVIHNGIDTQRFYPAKIRGQSLRKQWGVKPQQTLIGAVGRIDPMKGIPVFLDAVATIKQDFPNLRFVWVGAGDAHYEKTMYQQATTLGLDDVLIWAGRHTDMLAVYNTFDISSSSSCSEGFPNVLGEAMACGVPCVVTDVGDSALVVGNVGMVVLPRDSQGLSDAWIKMLRIDKLLFQKKAISGRNKVHNEFSVVALIENTEHVLINIGL